MINWDSDLLQNQYKTMTLQDIGDYYGVTRERIRQVMEEFGLRRNKHRQHTRLPPPRYNNLKEYLERHRVKSRWDSLPLATRFLPKDAICSECGSSVSITFHHIVYPAMSEDDVQILCRSCHKIKHNGKMNYIKQISLYNDFNLGLSYRELQVKYNICLALVHKILYKVRNGNGTLKR